MKFLKLFKSRQKANKDARVMQTYETVKIGNQIWMAENLNVSHYRNGDPIPQIQDAKKWEKLRTGAWRYYEHDEKNGKNYSKLYNGFAVFDPRGIAPEGWHVPSENEWDILNRFADGGFKLKEIGFSGVPGYERDSEGFLEKNRGTWWEATENIDDFAWSRYLVYDYEGFGRCCYHKANGFSVRCLRD